MTGVTYQDTQDYILEYLDRSENIADSLSQSMRRYGRPELIT